MRHLIIPDTQIKPGVDVLGNSQEGEMIKLRRFTRLRGLCGTSGLYWTKVTQLSLFGLTLFEIEDYGSKDLE